jgi:mono/diheme cytochrome c family protein
MNGIAKAGLALVAAVLLAGAGWWMQRSATPVRVALQPDDLHVLAAGERVYLAHCAACHGARLEGQPNWRTPGADGRLPAPPHDASGHTWHHADEVLFNITKHGVAKAANLPDHKSAMPAYDGVLSDDEIIAVLSWIKSRWPPEVRARHDQINQRSGS